MVRKPFLSSGTRLSSRAYARPVNAEFFDEPDSENFVVHIAGFLAPMMNLRLLKTFPHGGGHVDALYMDLDNGKQLRVEWELNAANFIAHQHDPALCDLIFCWDDDLSMPERRQILDRNSRLQIMDFNKILHHYLIEEGLG